MAHPHRSEAHSSSRAKMRAITGKGGGGSHYMGHSPFKRAGEHGEQKSYHSHNKSWTEPEKYAHGGKVKKRADRHAKGGKAKPRDWVGNKEGWNDETSSQMTPYEKKQATGKWARGGEISESAIEKDNRKRLGGEKHQPYGNPKVKEYEEAEKGEGHARGGRAKHKGDVNIVVQQPHPHLPAMPPGGMGAPLPPPGGGAPPPMAPQMGGAPPMGGAPMGGGAMPPNPQAAQALAAIAGGGGGGMGAGMPGKGPFKRGGRAYADGGGAGPSDAEWTGPPGGTEHLGPINTGRSDPAQWRATGGKVGPGVMPEREKKWAGYAKRNKESERGATGERAENSLATPGGKEKLDKRARGGRLPDAGQATGVARLERYLGKRG